MAVALVMAVQARASLYDITFTGGGSAANGQIDVVGNDAVSGYLTVTAGAQSVGTYDLIPGSGTMYGAGGGGFNYDNQVFVASNPFLDNGGLLFGGGNTLINLWGDGVNQYSLYGLPPAYAPAVDNGIATISLAAVPEPTTMIAGALLLLPFGASTLRILRKNRTA